MSLSELHRQRDDCHQQTYNRQADLPLIWLGPLLPVGLLPRGAHQHHLTFPSGPAPCCTAVPEVCELGAEAAQFRRICEAGSEYLAFEGQVQPRPSKF